MCSLPAAYKQLEPVAGQWDIAVAATKTADKSVFEPQICTEDKVSAACNQPLLSADAKDKLQVTATLRDGATQLKTLDNLPAKRVVIKACYTKPSTADRPWRKANDVIDVSSWPSQQSCTSQLMIPYFWQRPATSLYNNTRLSKHYKSKCLPARHPRCHFLQPSSCL